MTHNTSPTKGWKYYLQGIALSITSLLLVLIVLNYVLGPRSNHESGMDWQDYNDSINQRNLDYANKNPYGFTDRVRNYRKGGDTFRIAVLGDSFIWGDGIPHEMVWSHRLEQKLQRHNKNIEVLHWGRNGWSTLDELDFYLAEGRKFDVDLLLIGFVKNDPDLGNTPLVTDWADDHPWLAQKLPGITRFISNKISSHRYNRWEDALYTEENLNQYQQLLLSLDSIMAADSLPYMFVLTPNFIKWGEDKFHKIATMMEQNQVPYLNLLPQMRNRFENNDSLRSSPVNGHPGPVLTGMFADSVYHYLLQENYLPIP